MSVTTASVATHELTLPQELVLMLLNEETGYFRQVVGWDLNCAIIGAVLGELSLRSRIDTDLDSLQLLDATKTGNPVLDPILEKIAEEPTEHNAEYWIERLVFRAPAIIEQIMNRLVDLKILDYHDGEFWTLSRTMWHTELYDETHEATAAEFVKTRVSREIFDNEIPSPRDVIIIALLNTCDVLRFIFQLEEESEERIKTICRMELIGRSIANAVANNFSGGSLQRSALAKTVPTVPLHKVLLNPHVRSGNIPAIFAELSKEFGPVFQLRPPFSEPMYFIGGPRVNQWVQRNGRQFLRARDYFADFEKVFGASGLIPAVDGADHFRLRKAMSPGYSRERLEAQLDEVYRNARTYMADWKVGDSYSARSLCRRMINAQISPFTVSIESQDIVDDLMAYKERGLSTHVARVLPKFMLYTPGMRRKAKIVNEVANRVQRVHTPAQRAGRPRDLADDILSLQASDPQFLPESNIPFMLSAPLLASMYLGDALSFAVYAMAAQPELYDQIKVEADALFSNGNPEGKDFSLEALDVTHRFLMEVMRMHPVVPMSIRNVMNACVVEGFELPVGARIHIATTASHYMESAFPEPFKFDIDRYTEPRNEHRSRAYAPYGLGTHTCLGTRLMERQLTINVLIIAHYFTLEVSPEKLRHKFKYSPFPSNKPTGKLKFVIAEKRREINV